VSQAAAGPSASPAAHRRINSSRAGDWLTVMIFE